QHVVLAVIIMACGLLHACKKDHPNYPHQPPTEPETKAGKLKEIVVERLPSPFYHFEYTDKGVPTEISFASGLYIYRTSFSNGKLARMTNAFNGNALVYNYNGKQVDFIRDIRPSGLVLWNYSFEYNNKNQLTEVRWYKMDNTGADSLLMRKAN